MKFEVTVSHTWANSKTIHFTVIAPNEKEAREEALLEARASDPDDWSDIRMADFIESIEEIEVYKDGS